MPETPDDSKFLSYADYLVDKYTGENGNLPPYMWASFAAD